MDWQCMPENMRWWLQSYNEAISQLDASAINVSAQPQRRAARAVILPLLTCQWNQSPLYNEKCPIYKGKVAGYYGKQSQTGCTATAMAQVMNYHQWPKDATQAIPAYDYVVDNLQKDPRKPKVTENFRTDELPPITFDWNNMRGKYLAGWNDNTEEYDILPDVTDAQRAAVATLMQYCGHSIKMAYSPEASGAWAELIPLALTRYFDYDKGVHFVQRCYYTIDQWEKLIYDELAAKRPVIYSASANAGGHTFVCDGYDGQGLFHINWGWEGESDQYFSLSLLNSNVYEDQYVGGLSFTFTHGAVIGCQPPVEGSTPANTLPTLIVTSTYRIDDNNTQYDITFGLRYHSLDYPEATFQIKLFYYQESDKKWCQFSKDDELLKLKEGKDGACRFVYDKQQPNEPDGEYLLYVMGRWLKPDGTYDDWQRIGDQCFWWNVKKGQLTVYQTPYPEFKVTELALSRGTGDVNTANELALTLQNGENEYQGELMMTPYFIGSDSPENAWNLLQEDSNAYPVGNSSNTGVFLRANTTDKVFFTFMPEKEGTYLMIIFDAVYSQYPLGYFAISFPSGATGIQEHTAVTSQPAEATYYNLSGQRVSKPKKGLYILNGKKVLIK